MKKLLILVLLLFLTGCSDVPQKHQKEFYSYLDTYSSFIYYGNKEDFDTYSALLEEKLSYYDKLFDIYNSYDSFNNLKTLNDNAGIKEIKLDIEALELLTAAKTGFDESNGKVNIAFGSVLKIWHSYREAGLNNPQNAALPSYEDLREADNSTDINALVIDLEKQTAFINDKNMQVDVGAVAKGYCCEQIANELKQMGIENCLINLGGNVVAIGTPPERSGWNIGITNPWPENGSSEITTYNTGGEDISLVTSGNYQRYYTVDGKKYNHIIDPETLFPADIYASVTIINPSSYTADLLSTALFTLPLSDGKALAEKTNSKVIWVLNDGTIEQNF